jgi:hypothetical protein
VGDWSISGWQCWAGSLRRIISHFSLYITLEQNQGRLRLAKSLSGLRKRLYLVELVGNDLDEHGACEAGKALAQKEAEESGGPAIPPEQVLDVLFPETKGWKDARPGETKGSKSVRAALRKQATKTLE